MNIEKNGEDNDGSKQQKNDEQHEAVQNPFEPGEGKKISQEDIDNEQKFKEALSERD